MTITTQKEALAFHFGWDINDVDWYQPKPGERVKTTTLGEYYYCATRTGSSSALPKGYTWAEVRDSHLNPDWKIFRAHMLK